MCTSEDAVAVTSKSEHFTIGALAHALHFPLGMTKELKQGFVMRYKSEWSQFDMGMPR